MQISSAPSETQQLVVRWRRGELTARDRLIDRLHPELAQIAAARLRRDPGASLSTGDLINDVVLRLIRIEELQLADRAHFLALASRLMRNILTDHARAKATSRRAHHKVTLVPEAGAHESIDLAELNAALIRLGAIDAQMAEIVEMRYFGGMTTADIAAVCGLSEPTIKRRWQSARAWLADALSSDLARG